MMTALRKGIFNEQDEAQEQEQESLEDVVARFRASTASQELRISPPPSPEAIAHLIEHVKNEQPLSPSDVAEWNKRWAEVSAEIRGIDEEDDVAEGRGF